MTAYTFDENILSDLHKDARGFRPTQGWMEMWSELCDESKQTVWNNLLEELRESIQQERREKEEAIAKFEKRISDTIKLGAGDTDTAIRWILEGENFSLNDYQYGADYVSFHFNLPYANQWRNLLDKITQEKVTELYYAEVA